MFTIRQQAQRLLARPPSRRHHTPLLARCCVETDSCGIPTQPTWSVDRLLSSYPTPTISPATFKHLHALSALVPPKEGNAEHDDLKRELEDLVKLVEAVKLVNVEENGQDGKDPFYDGRIWPQGTGIPLSDKILEDGCDVSGRALQCHGARASNGFYVVNAQRAR